jgi:mRNA interferase YafQ
MLKVTTTKRFLKDVALAKRRGKDLSKLKEILECLSLEKEMEPKYRNHRLSGNFNDRWECHIEPDWLLIYFKTHEEIIFEKTGTHSDLF